MLGQTVRSAPQFTITFAYDDDGLLAAAGGLAIYRDSANGRVTGSTITSGDGTITDEYQYDSNGQLSS